MDKRILDTDKRNKVYSKDSHPKTQTNSRGIASSHIKLLGSSVKEKGKGGMNLS